LGSFRKKEDIFSAKTRKTPNSTNPKIKKYIKEKKSKPEIFSLSPFPLYSAKNLWVEFVSRDKTPKEIRFIRSDGMLYIPNSPGSMW
jgi:hypothetical protein